MRYLLIVAIISCWFHSNAQQKFEKEVRIDASEVPEKAVGFVEQLQLSKKIKWYKETGFNTTSYEAKTRHNGKRLSIEFSIDGTFEDVEIITNEKSIPATSLTKIKEHLGEKHAKYRFDKIQTQYIGSSQQIKMFIKDLKPGSALTINYEIVISTKVDGAFVLFEYLFDSSGTFLSRARVVQKMTDNIEY